MNAWQRIAAGIMIVAVTMRLGTTAAQDVLPILSFPEDVVAEPLPEATAPDDPAITDSLIRMLEHFLPRK